MIYHNIYHNAMYGVTYRTRCAQYRRGHIFNEVCDLDMRRPWREKKISMKTKKVNKVVSLTTTKNRVIGYR